MFTGAHVLLYTKDPDADRAFFRDVLELRAVDAGHGWLIFALPPAEAAFHPVDAGATQPAGGTELAAVLYLMCEDVRTLVRTLEAKGVACGPLHQERWGLRTTIGLPSGAVLGLYQPSHQTAI